MTKTIIAIALVLAACGKGNKDREKLASACTTGSEALKHDSGTASADDFQQLLGSTILACSQACDAKDDPSCKQLDVALKTTCKVMPDFCSTMCDTAKSDSLKSTACGLAKKKG